MFSDYFGGTRAALLQEKNARDYTRRTTHFAPPDHDSRASGSGLGRERGLADARRRASDLADDAIAAPQDDHIVSLSTTGPQSLGRERDPLLGLRDEVGHGLVEDVLLVGR